MPDWQTLAGQLATELEHHAGCALHWPTDYPSGAKGCRSCAYRAVVRDYRDAVELAHPASPGSHTAAGESGPVQPGTEGEKRESVGLSAALDALAKRTAQDPGTTGMEAACWHAVVALEAAEPLIRADERERLVSEHVAEQDAIHADLGKLLEATGLGDYARPISSHEVMLQCIAEVKRLRAVAEGLPSETAP